MKISVFYRRAFARAATAAMLALTSLVFFATGVSAQETVGPFTYYSTTDLCRFNVTPLASSVETGNLHTVAATVMASGPVGSAAPSSIDSADVSPADVYEACVTGNLAALTGVDVKFTVTSGPNIGRSETLPLDSSGQAFFGFTSALAGVDEITATVELPDICEWSYEGQVESEAATSALSPACENNVLAESGPMAALTGAATVTWLERASAPLVATRSPDPTVRVARLTRCVNSRFRLNPSYTGGQVRSSTLFVDGRRVQTLTGSSQNFKLNSHRYKSGKHNYEVVTIFADGRAASKFGSFSRCAARSALRRTGPRFTG
ncbi:MAG TPA: hypothetical protein VGO97_05095 [Solirubrobacterales bacterium]|nr:hypothetical protein [Solirubrobacterales bacterium]